MTGVETEVLSAFLDKEVLLAFWPFFWIILLQFITTWVQFYRDWKMRKAKDKIIHWLIDVNREQNNVNKDLILQSKVSDSERANQSNLILIKLNEIWKNLHDVNKYVLLGKIWAEDQKWNLELIENTKLETILKHKKNEAN